MEYEFELWVILIASVTTVACTLPGVFLVLRRMALMSDAISHAILFGIVIAFLFVESIGSPFLIVGAALTGVLTVALTELLIRTQRLKEDAAIGLVFPLLFSIGVIIVSQELDHVHLDIDAVLLGNLEFAALDVFEVFGREAGPPALWVMGIILLVNIAFIALFYKELKLVTFDKGLAATLGFSPVLIHYALMSLTSVTAVGAFDAVGSILVVALMIAPPASAYLLTDRLSHMLAISAGLGLLACWIGVPIAFWLDLPISGTIASMTGVLFMLCLLFSPDRGLVAKWILWRNQKWEFASQMLAVHLLHHEGSPEEMIESETGHLVKELDFTQEYATQVVAHAIKRGYIDREGEQLSLTPLGRETARDVMVHS